MRTKSADIKNVSSTIREWNRDDSLSKSLLNVYKCCKSKQFKLYHKKQNLLETTWFKNFITKIKAGKVPIILTWKNITSNMYNDIIRKYIHGSNLSSDKFDVSILNNYVAGDYAMFNNFYVSRKNDGNFYTSDMIKIIDITTCEKKLFSWKKLKIDPPKKLIDKGFNSMLDKLSSRKIKFKVNICNVRKLHRDTDISVNCSDVYEIMTIDRENLDTYNDYLKFVQENIENFYRKYKSEKIVSKLWNIYHKILVEPYAEINFGYSITVYKSQGSTFDNVYVDVDDINCLANNEEIQKALYTAAGRAADELNFIL